jgi:hypothetical protein
MKLKTKLVIGSAVLIICMGASLLLLVDMKNPTEQMAEALLDGKPPTDMMPLEQMTPELANFIGWYKPMVVEASPEVRAVMKKFDPKFRSGWANRNEEIERYFPTDEWLQRLLNMDIAFDDYSDYSSYLSDRWRFYHAQNDPEELSDLKERYGLEKNASLDVVIEASMRESVKLNGLVDQAIEEDPRVYGGKLSKEGVFIPFKHKTVYVQQDFVLKGIGVPDWVPRELTNRAAGLPPSREIPDDIDIIYLDENGQPLSEGIPPSFGNGGEIEGFSRGETDTVFESATGELPLAEDFDSSFPDDLPPSDAESFEFEKPNLLQSVAGLEKQLTPERIEAELSEGLSPERFNKAQLLIDQYGSAEGLRRLRESDPEAATQFERQQNNPPGHNAPPGKDQESTHSTR